MLRYRVQAECLGDKSHGKRSPVQVPSLHGTGLQEAELQSRGKPTRKGGALFFFQGQDTYHFHWQHCLLRGGVPWMVPGFSGTISPS